MKENIAIFSILINIFLALSKVLIGFISGSSAVLADGFHSFSDIISSVIGYFGIKTSQKPVDEKHPYGHYKFEVLSGGIITLFLLLTGIGVIYQAYGSIFDSKEIKIEYLAFIVMFLSAVINFISSKVKIYYGKKENSLTLISDGSHDKADVLVSVAVMAGLFFSRYWIYADAALALLIGLYIIKESFSLGKEAADSLLDASAGTEIEEKIRSVAKEMNIDIYSLKTQKKGSAITANLEIKLPSNLNVSEATSISEKLRKNLMCQINSLKYIAIQIISHEVATGFYKPGFSKGFGWQRNGEGPGGYCACSKCGYKIIHKRGTPCSEQKCPKCGFNLARK